MKLRVAGQLHVSAQHGGVDGFVKFFSSQIDRMR
jgi:hypothetical protein